MAEIGKFTPMKPLRYLSALAKTLIMLMFNKYDVCYIALTCHGKGFLKDAPFALMCKMFGKKLIIHQHNKGMSSCINHFPYKFLIPLVYKNSKVILLSWRLYDDIKSVVDRSQIAICPNGIPDIPVMPREEQHGVPHILFLSNLIKSKGVLDLLDACCILKERGVQFICDYVGRETPEITARIFRREVRSRDLDDRVIYHGALYGDDKERILRSSDIFVFPTFYENETFGLVLLEAMLHYLPVVAYSEGGIPDIVEDEKTGYIIPKHNVHCLANKIEYLIENPAIAESMGLAGREKFDKEFRLDIWEQRISDIL